MNVFSLIVFSLTVFAAVTDAARDRRTLVVAPASDCDFKKCSHGCESHVGGFPKCVCPPGMTLERDGRTCKDSTSFILATFRAIKLFHEDTEEESLAPVGVRCLDYHYERKELYAYINNTILRYPLPKGETASPARPTSVQHQPGRLVTRSDTAVTSLAVDWVNDVIYYISEQQSAISVTSLEGENQRTILSDNSTSAKWQNLVVDPFAKKLFWIGEKGVSSSDLEGKNHVTGLISWLTPSGIALDVNSQLIYVIGRHDGSENRVISRANYNGTRVGEDVEVRQPAEKPIFGFGVVGNTAYWESSYGGANLYKCDLQEVKKPNKGRVFVLAELNQLIYDMKVYHKDVQKSPK